MDIPCVGAVVHDAAGRLLLVRRGSPPGAGRWSLPGGRVEPGESEPEAIRREVLEETGLQIVVVGTAGAVLLPAPNAADRYRVTDFVARVSPGSSLAPVAGDDAADARWVGADELGELPLTDGLLQTLRDWGVVPVR